MKKIFLVLAFVFATGSFINAGEVKSNQTYGCVEASYIVADSWTEAFGEEVGYGVLIDLLSTCGPEDFENL